MRAWVLVFIFVTQYGHAAGLKEVTLGFTEALPQTRWIYESRPKLSKNQVYVDLYKMKLAIQDQHYKTCLLMAGRLWKSAPVARNWIMTHELYCRHQQFLKDKVKELVGLDRFLDRVYQQNKNWLFSGTQSDLLLARFLDASMAVLGEQVSRNRQAGWETAFRLVEFADELGNSDRARLYKWMGELAFSEQNLTAALDYFERSLNVMDQADVRKKVAILRKELHRPLVEESSKQVPDLVQASRDGSEDEQKIFDRFKSSVKSRDYVSAVEDGVELITQYPGSSRSDQAAKQIQSIYLALADTTDEKMKLIKEQVLKSMRKCDGQRLMIGPRPWLRASIFKMHLALAATV